MENIKECGGYSEGTKFLFLYRIRIVLVLARAAETKSHGSTLWRSLFSALLREAGRMHSIPTVK